MATFDLSCCPCRKPDRRLLVAAAVCGLVLLGPRDAFATTFTVTNLNDSGSGSLRDTIALAGNGDTINFAVTGTISLLNEIAFSKSLTINGPGASSLALQPVPGQATRLFHITGGTGTISDLTITKGRNNGPGSGIYKSGGNLTLNSCVLSDNRTSSLGDGGAIYNDFGNLTLNNCTLTENLAPNADGGAIFNRWNLTLNGCVLSANSSASGGAISSIGTFGRTFTATVTNCVFLANIATFLSPGGGSGGAIHSFGVSDSSVTLTVESCVFSDNKAIGPTSRGGAISGGGNSSDSAITIRNSTLDGNSAQEAGAAGGAIYHFANNSSGGNPSVTVLLVNCTVTRNTAPRGGALFNQAGSTATAIMEVASCTLSRNGNGVGGGGGETIENASINPAFADLALRNTILQKESALNVNLVNSGGTVTSQGYNLADDNAGGFFTGPADQINLDPKLDPAGLQNNGGGTQTIAILANSPALDRGNHFGITTDQRGVPRPIDVASVPNASDGTDIGAYEAPADPIQDGSSSFVVRTTADHDDGICGATDCTLREAIARSNTVPGLNAITFALTGTITLQPAAGGQLNITEGLTITGPGARFLKISAFTQTRVFVVSGPGTTTLSGLTIADGRVGNSNAGDSEGGGIYNLGTLALVDCLLDFNRALGGSGFMSGQNGGSGRGGGIFNTGVLTLNRCTLKNNGAGGGRGADHPGGRFTYGGIGGDGRGAAIYNNTGASLTTYNCTFTGNSAYGANGGNAEFGGNGGHGLGGAVFNLGTLDISASTFSGNSGSGGAGGLGFRTSGNGAPGISAGGLVNGGGTSTARNSISAGNTTPDPERHDVYGAFTSGGFNLIGKVDGSTGFTAATDQTGTNAMPLSPQLGPLASNGGPTDTMAISPGGPALDKGNSFGVSEDQRGFPRPVDHPAIANASGGDGADIGAFEFNNMIVVTTLDDHDDAICNLADCTLREAITKANIDPGDEIIKFQSGLTGIVQLSNALPTLSTNMTVQGPGANRITVRRNTGGNYRIFTISNGTTTGPTVTITGLTIANGAAISGSFPASEGGGIFNDHGTFTLRNCALDGNQASSSGGGLFSSGASVASPLVIENCLFRGNTATANGGGGMNNTGKVASVTNCTFSANTAGSYGGGLVSGGGISSTATISVRNCTFATNTAGSSGLGAGGGVCVGYGSAFSIANCLFGTNTRGSIVSFENLVSQGHNISEDAAGGDGGTGPGGFLNGPADIRNTNPMLDVLANNGGTTQTHALQSTSLAINSGDDALAPLTDQRGYLRNGGSDRGAFEFNGAPPAVPLLSVVSRKPHGGAGTFDIALPLSGNAAVESRTGGANGDHTVIFTFPSSVTFNSAGVTAGTGSVSGSSGSGTTTVAVNLTGVTNAQEITVTLLGVNNGTSTGDTSVQIGVLVGDTNGDGFVNAGDSLQTRNRSGQATDATNFRSDVNTDGFVNSGDTFIVRARSGTALP